MSGNHADLYREFVVCTQEERRVKDDLAAIKEVKARLVADILLAFAEDGVAQMTLEVGGRKATIYPHETLRARAADGDQDRLNAVLRKHGHDSLIRESVNAQTLSAFVREELADDALPADILSALDVYSDLSVRVRQSTKSGSQSSRALKNLKP